MDLYDVSDIILNSLNDLSIQLDSNNTTEQATKDTQERYTEKPVVPQVRAGEFGEDVDDTLTQIENAKYASLNEPITRDNFYDHTACNWNEVDDKLFVKPDYVSDSGSKYWYTDNGVYRMSNHWGFGVGSCDWTLNSHPELSYRDEGSDRLGYAEWKDFTHTDDKSFPQIVEMLTPEEYKQAGLIGETDQQEEVYYDNYRSRQLEPKEDFVEDVTYPAGIETRLYTQCAAEGEGAQPTNVVNKVEENPVNGVSENVTDSVSGQNGTPRNYGSKKPGATSFKNYAFELTTIEKLSAKDLRYINREFPEYSQRKLFNDLMEVDNELIALKNDPNVQSYLLANTKSQTNIIDSSAYEYLDKLTSLSKKVDDLIDNVKSHLPDEYLGEYDSTFSYGESVKSSIDEYYNKISDKIQSVVASKNSSFELTTIEKIAEEIVVEADLESKKPYLLKDLEKSKFDKKDYDQIIEICNDMDPTGKRAVFTQWILRRHALDGEEFSGVESSDYLQKFLELKKSKKLQNADADINHYKSFADLKAKVDQVLEETGGYTSKRKEEKSNTEEGIQKIDQDGDIELYVVNTQEAAAKEFRNTEWCVKDPKFFNQYAETDKNFYYFKKDGEPYILLHASDFKYKDDSNVYSDVDLSVAKLMVKHNLPFQDELLNSNLRTPSLKEDENAYNQAIINLIDGGKAESLIKDRKLTRKDGDLFTKAILKILDNPGTMSGLRLLDEQFVTKEDGELFYRVIDKVIQDKETEGLIRKKIITKEDGELYNKIFNQVIDDGNTDSLLFGGFITRDDGELFTKALKSASNGPYWYYLFSYKIITKEDGDLYTSLLKKALDSGRSKMLLENGYITREDGDLFTSLVNEELDSGKYYYLLLYHIITNEDGDLFNKAVEKAINNGDSFNIISSNIVTREDGDLYNRCLESAIVDESGSSSVGCSFSLIKDKLLTREDGYTFNKALKSLIDYNYFEIDWLLNKGIITEEDLEAVEGEDAPVPVEPTPMDELSNDDTNKESAFEFTDINKLADFVQEFNRQDELTDEQKNKFVNRLPVEEANKDQKDELIEDAKQTGKVITHIPKSLNYPYIEDEMAGNKLFYSDLDWMEMSDLSEM